MRAYIDLMRNILDFGKAKQPTRMVNGKAVDVENATIGLPCQSFTHNMQCGFPLLTTKKMYLRSILVELEAFLGGITDKRWLHDRKCTIWDEWSNPEALFAGTTPVKHWPSSMMINWNAPTSKEEEQQVGYTFDEWVKKEQKRAQKECNDLGTYYAWQMRRFDTPYEGPVSEKLPPQYDSPRDQIAQIVKSLKNNPYDRRMVCSMWNPNQMHTAALPSCHYSFNVMVYEDTINLQVSIRSNDMVLGWPYNTAYYATLLLLFAKVANKTPTLLKIDSNDAHIYLNQIEGIEEQLKRNPRKLPHLEIKQPYEGEFDLFKWTHKDIELSDYNPHPPIKFEVTV